MPLSIKLGLFITWELALIVGTVFGCVIMTTIIPGLLVFFGGILAVMWSFIWSLFYLD